MHKLSKSANPKTDDLDAIVGDVKASRCFGRSHRQLRLFEYLLKYSLAGNSSELTQYSIALDVLERPESFDAAIDSIVRVEMHRLRANLEIYNNSQSEYLITIPPASFEVFVVPRKQSVFSTWKRGPVSLAVVSLIATAAFGFGIASSELNPKLESAAAVESACSAVVPNITVSYIGDESEEQSYVESVLLSSLVQHTGFNVLKGQQQCTLKAAPVFDVQFTMLEQGNLFSVSLNVVDLEDNSIIESHHMTGSMGDVELKTALYYKLVETANMIALSNGTLARYAYSKDWGSAKSRRSYGCLIAMYDSYSGEIDSEFENVHACLVRSVKSGVATLDNYGALASSYLDQARNDRPSDSGDPLRAARLIFEQHDESWLDSSEMAVAKIYYEVERPDFNSERMLLILEAVQAKYNINPQVLLVVAPLYGYSLGRWDTAKDVSEFVKRIYPVRDQSVYAVDAGYAFMSEDMNSSNRACYKFYGENSIFVNLIVNGCARLEGDKTWVDVTEVNLKRLNMEENDERMAYLATRIDDPQFISKYETLLNATKDYMID